MRRPTKDGPETHQTGAATPQLGPNDPIFGGLPSLGPQMGLAKFGTIWR
jgi:hypothetical protein